MRLFNIFKKKEKVSEVRDETNVQQEDSKVKYSITKDGRLQVDFYDEKTRYSELYDTTRLIVSDRHTKLAGEEISVCAVSWYIRDAGIFSEAQYGDESVDARNYKGILAQIDVDLLQSDEDYCTWVMKGLLDKKRVNKYLENGLQEHTKRPCGIYVGGVRQKVNEEGMEEEGYEKFFNPDVGEEAHNSSFMIKRREKHRESVEAKRQRDIAEKRAKIERLQEEIDEMLI